MVSIEKEIEDTHTEIHTHTHKERDRHGASQTKHMHTPVMRRSCASNATD